MKLNYLSLYHLRLTLIGLPLLLNSVQAAHHEADPIGKWMIEISDPNGQTYYPEATFTKEDGELKGSYYSQLSGETFDLEAVSFNSDGRLNFTLNHPQIIVRYAGDISGNDMTGTANITYQGQTGDTSFSAKRKPTLTVVGNWNFKTTINGDTYKPNASIREEAGELAGTYTSAYNNQDMEMKEITVNGNQLSFTTGAGQFTLKYTGTIEGNTISGTMSASSSQGSMDGSFTATRSSD